MAAIVGLFLVRDEFVATGYCHVDSDPERVALVVRVIWLFDGNVAAIDMVAKLFKPSSFIQNELVDRLRLVDSAIGDLYWQLHNWFRV